MRSFLFLLALSTSSWHGSAATFHIRPEKGKARNAGTAVAPWRTLEEAISDGAFKRVKAGDLVLLYSGNHGSVSLEGDNRDFITLAAAPQQRPQLERFEIRRGSKWRIRGLTISPSFVKNKIPQKGFIVSLGERGPSSELILEDCFVYTALDSKGWGVEDWMKASNGVLLGRHGKNLTARNNHILNTRFALNLAAPDSLAEANMIANFSGDGIRAMRDGQTLQFNVIKNNYCSAKDGDKNHDDAIQCFLFNKGTGTLRRISVRGNLIVNRDSPNHRFPNSLQAIGFFDGPLIEFKVEQNVVLTSHWHGVSLYDAQQCVIQENTVFTHWLKAKPRPWVMIGQKKNLAKGNVVRNNLAHSFNFKADKQVKAEGNRKVTRADFLQKYQALSALLIKKFGAQHPVSGVDRVGQLSK